MGSSYATSVLGAQTRYMALSGAGNSGAATGVQQAITDNPPGLVRLKAFNFYCESNGLNSASTVALKDASGATYATVTVPASTSGHIEGVVSNSGLVGVGNMFYVELTLGGTAIQSIQPIGVTTEFTVE